MQVAVSIFPNILGNQMSKKRRIQDEGRTYKTYEQRVPLCWYNQINFCGCLPTLYKIKAKPKFTGKSC